MRVEGITNTSFKAAVLKINSAENKHFRHLTKTVMDTISVNSPYRSGKATYFLGMEDVIEIEDPKKCLIEYLKKIGIKFSLD